MRHDPTSGTIIIMLRALKMHGMAQAVGELTEQGSPAFEAAVPILSQLLKAETADREVRSTAYQLKAPRAELVMLNCAEIGGGPQIGANKRRECSRYVRASFRSNALIFRACRVGAYRRWRKIPPREMSMDLVADERLGRVTGRVGAS